MRLSKIKLAGFKSFVDPTTIDLNTNLTGIVGPNGCGKSNTIDAVRWVMGESSAKHLRGDSMEDVIFNGSSDRKPVGQASVELIFDNNDGSLGGEYAKYAEIGVKRQVSRDGQSKYFLNGSRCRRRDITDIFLGTGLGPRSYAIIEQGMVSRLIEAKPEELRVYLEEAAGISKYRQRRRETENRIRHTRENLDRLNDLREEIDKHLKQLKRQANAAERFKEYKQQERQLGAELLVLKLNDIQASVKSQELAIGEQGVLQQQKIAAMRELESTTENKRQQQTEAQDLQNQHQAEFYRVGAEISRIEQKLQHQRETEERFQQQFRQIEKDLEIAKSHLQEDQQKLENSRQEQQENQTQSEALAETLIESRAAFDKANAEQEAWRQQWQDIQSAIAEPSQQAQVERARMEQIEQRLQHSKQQLEKTQRELESLSSNLLDEDILQRTETVAAAKAHYLEAEQQHQQRQQSVDELRETIDQAEQNINDKRSRLQKRTGQLASLEVLQNAQLGKDNQSLNRWLEQHRLNDKPRLAETITVEKGWEKALETVLGEQLEAVAVDSLESVQQLLSQKPKGALSFYAPLTSPSSANQSLANSLLDKITHNRNQLGWLSGIYCADDLPQALGLRDKLNGAESIITKDGLWLGPNWLRVSSSQSDEDSVIRRNQQISELSEETATLKSELETLEAQQTQQRAALKEQRASLQQSQQQLNETHRQQSQHESALHTLQNRQEQNSQRVSSLQQTFEELENNIGQLSEEHATATERRNEALVSLEELEVKKQEIGAQQHPLAEATNTARQQWQELQTREQQFRIRIESLKSAMDNLQASIQRSERQQTNLQQTYESLQAEQARLKHDDSLQEQLEKHLQERRQSEEKLQQSRASLDAIDHEIRELTQQRHTSEQAVEQVRSTLEAMKLKWQEACVRETTLKEQLAETGFEADTINEEMSEEAAIKTHEQQLEQVAQRIQRLGAINLAAIEEFGQESERKEYLDKQHGDLTEALETLESAIRKIDRDTRSLFKDTFDKVNNKVQYMFPRLFGGGKAYLELTDNDLLTTGVMIMAQPPGKRISNIHLMSGGEKALTAVAMVFAIFELNPAPFCMLDEVDAPLDDANVGRFCQLVEEMSSRIQFIFITHNKSTMELAENLMGVTMREMGVSRIVSVNVADAARMME